MSGGYPLHWPSRWLMTDERMGDGLWRALRLLPPGGGVVFRHYATPAAGRLRVFVQVRRRARARRQLVLSAGGLLPGADGVHGPVQGPVRGPVWRGRPVSWAAHDRRRARAGVRARARVLFISPLFATRSHPGGRVLTAREAARIGRGLPVVRIALGGMDARRWRQVRRLGFDGWAGIDAWLK
ncbi:thiamine phosphate synthase [Sphingomonas sp.]|uniref:thiamine phosphate synthase n=1 Tax=Sphingomonas sp. TaxID=28214 RepID=UPI003CC52010